MVNVRRVIKKNKLFYKNIGVVYCPALKSDVFFNSNGFRHLLLKYNRKWREIPEIILKLNCLKYVENVVKNAKEISKTRTIVVKKKESKSTICHYELVSKQKDGKVIRVILEKIGDGKIHFLSTMPHYKLSKKPLRAKLNTRFPA